MPSATRSPTTSATETATTATNDSPPPNNDSGSPPDDVSSPTKTQGPLVQRQRKGARKRPDQADLALRSPQAVIAWWLGQGFGDISPRVRDGSLPPRRRGTAIEPSVSTRVRAVECRARRGRDFL